jgi:hypothetical protein
MCSESCRTPCRVPPNGASILIAVHSVVVCNSARFTERTNQGIPDQVPLRPAIRHDSSELPKKKTRCRPPTTTFSHTLSLFPFLLFPAKWSSMSERNFSNPRKETNDNRVMRGPTGSITWFDPRTTTNEERTWAKPSLEANWFNPRPYDNMSVAWGTKPSIFVDPMTEFRMKK